MMTSCGGGSSNKGAAQSGDSEQTGDKGQNLSETAFSIMYDNGGTTVVFTKDATGNRKRLDYIHEDGDKDIVMYDFKADVAREYEDGQWKETDRMGNLSAEQSCNNFLSGISVMSDGYLKAGLTGQGKRTIAGKECTVIGGTFSEHPVYRYSGINRGEQVKIAVWNGLTMLLESNGRALLEAKAFTAKVPDEAFTKTTDVTWIKK
jgi:hypothetical protein